MFKFFLDVKVNPFETALVFGSLDSQPLSSAYLSLAMIPSARFHLISEMPMNFLDRPLSLAPMPMRYLR